MTVAKDLARQFGCISTLRNASREELEAVDGVGPKIAEQLVTFFADPRNASVLDDLLDDPQKKRIRIKTPETQTSSALAGAKFVFTGGLDKLTRGQAKQFVESLGARVVSSVSKATDFVVVGVDPGSKAEKAKELGVETMDEEAFVKKLREHGIEI